MRNPYSHLHWKHLRKEYIFANPLCKMCRDKNIIEKATEVDHIHGFKNRGQFFNYNNLQSLCKSCHSKKTHTAGGGRLSKKSQREARHENFFNLIAPLFLFSFFLSDL